MSYADEMERMRERLEEPEDTRLERDADEEYETRHFDKLDEAKMSEREKVAWWLHGWRFFKCTDAQWTDSVRDSMLKMADELLALLGDGEPEPVAWAITYGGDIVGFSSNHMARDQIEFIGPWGTVDLFDRPPTESREREALEELAKCGGILKLAARINEGDPPSWAYVARGRIGVGSSPTEAVLRWKDERRAILGGKDDE
jgi:hypothetical protein